MTIYSVDIMGGKGVKIDLGSSSVAAADGDALAPAFEAGLMDGIADNIAPLMENVNGLLDSLNTAVSGINKMLADSNQEKFSNILVQLEGTMSQLNKLSKSVGGKSSEIEAVIDNLAVLSEKFGG